MKKGFLLLSLALLTIMATLQGCKAPERVEVIEKPQYDKPLGGGQLALVKLTNPADIPDFTFALADTRNLEEAVMNSLSYLAKPSSKNFFPYGDITHQHMTNSLEAFVELLYSGMPPSQLNQKICEQFDVYTSVGWDGFGTVLFTGYYTPIFDASKVKTSVYKYPLYKRPNNLVSTETGVVLGREIAPGKIVKYLTREQINKTKMLKGTELVWLSDPFEVYIAHVQGSVRLRMPDRSLITASYNGHNGYEYVSVGKKMIEDRRVSSEGLSLQAMIDFFKKNPHLIDQYININPRFIFFNFSKGMPHGSLNEPVIANRVIATDKEIYPRAGLAFITTKIPKDINGIIQNKWYTGFVMDQDTGGALRAAGRCDLYMGEGDKAGRVAG